MFAFVSHFSLLFVHPCGIMRILNLYHFWECSIFMKIIVTGCGKIGTTLLASLTAEGHDVTALDNDAELISTLTDSYDIMGVCGNAVDCDTLEEAGVRGSDLFVAVTGSDELNMLSCFLAKRLGALHTVARIRNPEYSGKSLSFMRQQLDITLPVNPEKLAAQELFNTLKFPSNMKVETFSRRNFLMIELKLKEDSPLCGIPLSSLRNKFRANFLICAVQRGDTIHIPRGDFELHGGDKIALTANPGELHKLLKSMGLLKKQARDIMILGGSKTAFYLAQMLLSTGSSVTIIDKDKAICHELSNTLPGVMVIHGDGAHEQLLVDEGLRSQDAFVALTGNDEQNILLSFYAASEQVEKVLAKVNRVELATIAEQMGLSNIFSLRQMVSNVIVKYVRALENSSGSNNIETLYKLMDGRIEALEFKVDERSDVTEIPLKELPIKKDILLTGILRNRKPIIPNGDDMIVPGDRVIVLAAGHRLQSLTDILR